MRVIIVGLGVQGHKRRTHAGADCIGVVDPFHADAQWQDVRQVPLDAYDAALVCTPDEVKIDLLTHLLGHGKHVLVEKPLFAADDADLERLARLAEARRVVCYTAYNHRFEPHFVRMRDVIRSGVLGRIYSVRMFYGNGTARLVRESAWRDQGAGVLPDLGSHLLDSLAFWLDDEPNGWRIVAANRHENRAFDHIVFDRPGAAGKPYFACEMTMLSWRNHFTCDVFAEKGSAHIESLCKWGPSTFTLRDRKLPAGRPDEQQWVLTQPDPTWALEYAWFKKLCLAGEGGGNIATDLWLNRVLNDLAQEALQA